MVKSCDLGFEIYLKFGACNLVFLYGNVQENGQPIKFLYTIPVAPWGLKCLI